MNISVGIKISKKNLEQLRSKLQNLRSAMKDCGDYMRQETQNNFTKQQSPEGASWKPLRPATLRQKRGGSILTETGALRGGIRITRVTRTSVTIASTDWKGKFHQYGTRKMAQRKFIGLAPRHTPRIKAIIKDYLGI